MDNHAYRFNLLSSVLKKEHNAIAYHQVREAIAAKVMRFAYIKSEENVSDILTKPLFYFGYQIFKNKLVLNKDIKKIIKLKKI